MSYRTPGPLTWYPPASAGISLTPSGTAWTSSGWLTLMPATAAAILLSQLSIEAPSLAAENEFEIDIGRGAAGSEVVMTTFRGTAEITTRSDRTVTFPIPISGIGAGVRVAVRIRLSTTETGAWLVRLGFYDAVSFADDHLSVFGLRALPAAANGVSLTLAGSPAWTQGAWAELTTGFTDPTLIASVAVYGVSSTDFAIDLGTGAASSETVIHTLHGLTGTEGLAWFQLPRPYRVAASTRVAARIRQSSTGTGTIRLALLYYGDVVTSVPPPTSGGDGPTGTNPDAGLSLCGAAVPVAWLELQTTSGVKVYSKVDVALDSTFKEARVSTLGRITRALSTRQGLEVAAVESELYDHDRALRGFADAGTLLNKRCDYFLSSEAGLRAAVTPRRVFQGIVRDYQPGRNFTFRLRVEDFFTSLLGEFFGAKTLPQRTLSTADFPNLHATLVGKAVPILYGLCSDEDLGTSALGVVPAVSVGDRTLTGAFAGVWREFLICGHAVKQIQSAFIPSGGGLSTGTPEPSRTKITTDYGDVLLPGHPNYITQFGSTPYQDYNSNRYCTAFLRGPLGDLAADGRVPLAFNVAGIEDVGNGTGDLIDSLPRQILHLIVNWMLQSYTSGAWLSIPTIGSPAYARVRSTSFEAVKTASEARLSGGYLGAFMLGWQGQVHTFSDVMRQAAESGNFDLGINKDGQIVASMIDSAAASARAWTDMLDILADSFESRRAFEDLANRIRYRYQQRYVEPVATLTPDTGEFLPASLRKDALDWIVDNQTTSDATSITNHGETREYSLSLPFVRHAGTAGNVAAKVLAQRKNGPLHASHRVNLCGTDVDLGDNQTVTHAEGPKAAGWTDQLVRTERHTLDLDDFSVELTQRDLAGL